MPDRGSSSATSTSAADVHALVDAFEGHGIAYWISGGWGVDALLGEQTRPHRDLDVLVPLKRVLDVHRLMLDRGYRVETDWFPVRFELVHASGSRVDVHPVRLDEAGGARMELPDGGWWTFTPDSLTGVGAIAGRPVPCVTVAQQFENHLGYEPTATDRADIAVLAEAFSLPIPDSYTDR